MKYAENMELVMQTSVKDAYINVQGRLMYTAFLFLTALSIVVMGLESFHLVSDSVVIGQLINIMSIFLGVIYGLAVMMIVEVVYHDEIQDFPFIHYLARLTPELMILQRYAFLNMIFKRQIISVVAVMSAWIIVGGTHRAGAIVFGITMVSAFTLYGIHYTQNLLVTEYQSTDLPSR